MVGRRWEDVLFGERTDRSSESHGPASTARPNSVSVVGVLLTTTDLKRVQNARSSLLTRVLGQAKTRMHRQPTINRPPN